MRSEEEAAALSRLVKKAALDAHEAIGRWAALAGDSGASAIVFTATVATLAGYVLMTTVDMPELRQVYDDMLADVTR